MFCNNAVVCSVSTTWRRLHSEQLGMLPSALFTAWPIRVGTEEFYAIVAVCLVRIAPAQRGSLSASMR